ncbi:hypothetical protein C8242_17250 [Paracidovorax avenae]|nr:hypothetical protein C8242_17250 [Paracidovorax avenae]
MGVVLYSEIPSSIGRKVALSARIVAKAIISISVSLSERMVSAVRIWGRWVRMFPEIRVSWTGGLKPEVQHR